MQLNHAGVLIDSEANENIVRAVGGTHCVLIVEPQALQVDDAAPVWRVSVDVELRDPVLGSDLLSATLPTVMVGPVMHRRQIVAVARYPAFVWEWVWRFESDAGRARARVWLHPGESVRDQCGIFVLPAVLLRLGKQP